MSTRGLILDTVMRIPAGKVATYGQVAAAAGLPGRARLVGQSLRGLGEDSIVPWHRVVGSGGRITTPEASLRGRVDIYRAAGPCRSDLPGPAP